jgi:hypothetical protein
MKSTVITLFAASLLSGCVIYVGNGHAGDLQHEERKLTLNGSDLKQLQADTGAGTLEIIGDIRPQRSRNGGQYLLLQRRRYSP